MAAVYPEELLDGVRDVLYPFSKDPRKNTPLNRFIRDSRTIHSIITIVNEAIAEDEDPKEALDALIPEDIAEQLFEEDTIQSIADKIYDYREDQEDAAAPGKLAAEGPVENLPAAIPAPAVGAKYEFDNNIVDIADAAAKKVKQDKRLKMLACVDSIHDFWAGYRLKKDPTSSKEIKDKLCSIFYKIAGVACPAGSVDDNVKEFINRTLIESLVAGQEDRKNVNITISEVEESIKNFFNSYTPFLEWMDPNNVIRHDEILAVADVALTPTIFDDNALLSRLINENTCMITTGKKRIKQFTKEERKKVGDFMLEFLYGRRAGKPIEFTCDTAPGKVAIILQDFDDVCALITQLNIADSATSSIGQKIGKGKSIFTFVTTGDGPDFVSRRNILTLDKYNISYINQGFSEKKPYGFSMKIETKVAPIVSSEVEFNENYRQGASLNYLLGATLALHKLKAGGSIQGALASIPQQSGCMRFDTLAPALLTQIERDVKSNISIWQEIKRNGDQDQCDAAAYLCRNGRHVVLVTIDRPCFLLARLLGIPCILHYKDTFILSKNMRARVPPTAEQIAEFNANKKRKFVENYAPLYNTLRGASDFLASFAASVEAAIALVIPGLFSKKNPHSIFSNLLTARLRDIITHIAMIQTLVRESAWVADLSALDLDAKVDAINAIFSAFSSRSINVDGLAEIVKWINTAAGAGDDAAAARIFNIQNDYDIFDFSLSTFLDLYNSFNVIKNNINKNISRDNYIDFLTELNDKKGYHTLLNEICNSFIIEETGTTQLEIYRLFENDAIFNANKNAIEAYDIAKTNRKNMTDQKTKKNLDSALEIVKGVAIREFNIAQANLRGKIGTPPFAPAAAAAAPKKGGAIQRGGALLIDNQTKIANVFRNICDEAAGFVNNFFSETYPAHLNLFALKKYIDEQDDIDKKIYNQKLLINLGVISGVMQDSMIARKYRQALLLVSNISIPDFINQLAGVSALVQFTDSLKMKWLIEIENINNDSDENILTDDVVRLITVLLDPFTAAAAAGGAGGGAAPAAIAGDFRPDVVKGGIEDRFKLINLNESHPFISYKNTSTDRFNGIEIGSTILPVSLVALTVMNDIFNKNLGKETSYFINTLTRARLPVASLSIFDPFTQLADWPLLNRYLTNIVIALAGNSKTISRESFSGGKRQTLKRKHMSRKKKGRSTHKKSKRRLTRRRR
jgi:hypothetical protein